MVRVRVCRGAAADCQHHEASIVVSEGRSDTIPTTTLEPPTTAYLTRSWDKLISELIFGGRAWKVLESVRVLKAGTLNAIIAISGGIVHIIELLVAADCGYK